MSYRVDENTPERIHHWEMIIAAVQGSAMAQVWWEHTHPASSPQVKPEGDQPPAPEGKEGPG
jgi:hypothetical protein